MADTPNIQAAEIPEAVHGRTAGVTRGGWRQADMHVERPRYPHPMDLAWLKDFGGFIKDLATVVLPLLGVLVGARLASRSANDQWLKKERLVAYLALIDQLEAMLSQFSVGMKVSKFDGDADEYGHDYEGVEWAWHQQMDELQRAEVRVAILGGRLGDVYDSTAHELISEMLEAIDDDSITLDEWMELARRGRDLQDALIASAKADLEVPVIRRNQKLKGLTARTKLKLLKA